MKHLLAALCFALLLVASPAFAFDCDTCVGLNCAFACAGPNRPPAIEDQVPPDGFLLIFGEEPPPFGIGGRTVNIGRDRVPVIEWRVARREFSSLADFEIDADLLEKIVRHVGGVPIAWKTHTGKVYVAFPDTDRPLYRVSTRLFQHNEGTILLSLAHTIVGRGGCVPEVPGGSGTQTLQRDNAENCKD